jgi:hypothetical protein
MVRGRSGLEFFDFLWRGADAEGGEGGVDALLGRIETLVVFPAGLVGVCFGGVGERGPVRVDSGELTELLPGPVGVAMPEVLDVAVTVGEVETGFRLVSHHNA